MKIVVPIAGRGSRFKIVADSNPEYLRPKPIIDIKGKPMVRWAIESLPFVDLPDRHVNTQFRVSVSDLIFICLQEHNDKFGIVSVLKKYFSPKIKIILIPEITRGAVETAMAAEQYIDPDQDLIISDSDHYFDGTNLYKTILSAKQNVAGIIPVFKPSNNDPKWSYTLFDDNYSALAVGEKDVELANRGAYANIGGYYFSKAKMFLEEAKMMISHNEMYGAKEKQEFYVAPLYQRLIKKNMKIKVALIPRVWGLGTPQDLDFFLKDFNFNTSSG